MNMKTGEECSVFIDMDVWQSGTDAQVNAAIEAALPLSWKLKRLPPHLRDGATSLEDAIEQTRPLSFFFDHIPTETP